MRGRPSRGLGRQPVYPLPGLTLPAAPGAQAGRTQRVHTSLRVHSASENGDGDFGRQLNCTLGTLSVYRKSEVSPSLR